MSRESAVAATTYDERAHEDRLECGAAREEASEDELERGRVPVERVPLGRRRLEDRVDGPERDAQDHVERQQEEDAEPDDAGEREPGPEGVARSSCVYLTVGLRHPP